MKRKRKVTSRKRDVKKSVNKTTKKKSKKSKNDFWQRLSKW